MWLNLQFPADLVTFTEENPKWKIPFSVSLLTGLELVGIYTFFFY